MEEYEETKDSKETKDVDDQKTPDVVRGGSFGNFLSQLSFSKDQTQDA